MATQERVSQLRRDIATQEKQIAGLAKLLLDPDLSDPMTKRAIGGQMAEAQGKLEQLQKAIVQAGCDASEDAGVRLREAKLLFESAQACFKRVSSPAEFHRFVEDFVGPMLVQPDGRIVKMPVGAVGVASTGIIAATGLEPVTRGL